jgi:hypothetical protein
MPSVTVLSDQSKSKVIAARHWKERAPPIPVGCRGAIYLTDCGYPQTRTSDNRKRNPQPGHGSRLAYFGSFGNPSTISPMMLR